MQGSASEREKERVKTDTWKEELNLHPNIRNDRSCLAVGVLPPVGGRPSLARMSSYIGRKVWYNHANLPGVKKAMQDSAELSRVALGENESRLALSGY
jgi:hypothetical protein